MRCFFFPAPFPCLEVLASAVPYCRIRGVSLIATLCALAVGGAWRGGVCPKKTIEKPREMVV